MSPKELGLQVANGRRAATVSVSAESNEFECGGTKTVVCHDDGRDSRLDEMSNLREIFIEPFLSGVEIEEDYITYRLSCHAADVF